MSAVERVAPERVGPFDLGIAAPGRQMRAGAVLPVATTTACIAQARKAEAELAAGDDRGPPHGIPRDTGRGTRSRIPGDAPARAEDDVRAMRARAEPIATGLRVTRHVDVLLTSGGTRTLRMGDAFEREMEFRRCRPRLDPPARAAAAQ